MTPLRISYPTFAAAIMAGGVFSSFAADPLAQPSPEQVLGAMVVTASGFEQTVEDAPASITVIPREELEKRSYRDVTDALRDVPGVLVTGGGSSSDISIRGMAAGYTMILVDGRRQNSRETRPNSDGSGIEQGWLPPLSAIERIEIVRGPMSSLYGSDAMGGVINIITRKVPQQWGGSVRAETTQQENSDAGDIYQSSFNFGGPIKNEVLGLQIYGQTSHRNEDKIVNGFSKQSTEALNLKLNLAADKQNNFDFLVGRTIQKRESNPGKSMALESCGKKGCSPNTPSHQSYYKNDYSLGHQGSYAWGKINTYLQREETDNPVRNMNLVNTEFNSQAILPLGSSNVTTVGVYYRKESLDDQGNELKGSTRNHIDRYQWALYAENEFAATDTFSLTTGLRMNRDQNYGTEWTPRIYGVWKAAEQWTVKGGVSTGFKAPALRAAVADWGQITGGGGDPAIILGNPDLKPEKSLSQEIGLVFDNKRNFMSSVTLFNTDFKDKISEERVCEDTDGGGSSISTGNCVVNGTKYKFISERMNVDKANMRGIELTATWNIIQDLQLATNYTFTKSEQKSGKFAGRPLNKLPKHMLNATLDWNANSSTSVWSRVNFRGKSSDYLSRTSMANNQTPSFTFVDVGVNYKLKKDVKLGFGIYNVFDKKVDKDTYDAHYDGRRYNLSLTAAF